MKNTGEIINTAFFYFKESGEKRFEIIRSRGNVILEKYGARIERVIKPYKIIKGELTLPDEIHFAVYPNLSAKEAFEQDEEFLELKQNYIGNSVDKMFGFATYNTNGQNFFREMGDSKKTYGVALIYFKDGDENKISFQEYHNEACKILPEFGVHFERFLKPFAAANDFMEIPNEIHRFYFDTIDGMQQMSEDARMQGLFPKRDKSLNNLVFLLGEAIQ